MGSLIANGLAILGARLSLPVFSFVINVAVARLFGVSGLGTYVHLVSLMLVFQTLAGAGMPLLLTRDVSAHLESAPERMRTASAFGLWSGIGAGLALLAWALFTLPQGELGPAMVLALAVLPSGRIAMAESYLIARRAHHQVTWLALVENGVKVVASAAAVLGGLGIYGLCGAVVAGRLATATTAAFLLRDAFPREPEASGSEVRTFARALLPFAALLTLSMIYFRIDVFVVDALRGSFETGRFAAALTLFAPVLLLPDSAMAAVYPRLASAFRRSPDGYARSALLTARLLSAGLVPVSLVLISAAEVIIDRIYGPTFRGVAPTFRLLAASLPLHASNMAVGQALQAGHLQKTSLRIVVGTVFAHLAVSTVLVHFIGIQGAGFAMLFSSALATVLTLWAFHRRVLPLQLAPRTLAFVAILAVAVGVALVTPPTFAVVGAGAGLTLFGAAVVASGALRRDAWQELAQAFRSSSRPAQA